MEVVKVQFKFKIGDLVQFKDHKLKARAGLWDRIRNSSKNKAEPSVVKPQPWSVITRQMDECYGGCQNHYNLRGLHPSEDRVSLSFNRGTLDGSYQASEIELEEYVD